jgi:transposase
MSGIRTCSQAMRSRLEPMRRVARMLHAHEELLLNWFRAKGEISTGVVEGLNNKVRVVTRRSHSFRRAEIGISLFSLQWLNQRFLSPGHSR